MGATLLHFLHADRAKVDRVNDRTVPFPTGAIEAHDPVRVCSREKDPDLPQVRREITCED